MRKLIAFLLVLVVSVAGTIGKAEAKHGVVITPTSINRIGGPGTVVEIERDEYTAVSPDRKYSAVLLTISRVAASGEPCKIHQPSGLCLVKESVLQIHDRDTDTLKCENNIGSVLGPTPLGFIEHEGEFLVVVLKEWSKLGFYDLTCQEVYEAQLPESFTYPYELDGYLDFDVAYLGVNRDPVIVVAGGAYYEEYNEVLDEWEVHNNGLLVAVEWDPVADNSLSDLPGNFVATQSEILDSDGIVTDIDTEGDEDSNIISALISEREVSGNPDQVVEDTVIVVEGTRTVLFSLAIPQFASFRKRAYNASANLTVFLPSAVALSPSIEDGYMRGVYMYNFETLDGLRAVFTEFKKYAWPKVITPFEDAPAGVHVIGTDIAIGGVPKSLAKKYPPGYGLALAGYMQDLSGTDVMGFLYWGQVIEDGMSVASLEVVLGVQFHTLGGGGQYCFALAGNVQSSSTIVAGALSSSPVGGPAGATDVVNIEFTITKAEDDDEDDQGDDEDDQGED